MTDSTRDFSELTDLAKKQEEWVHHVDLSRKLQLLEELLHVLPTLGCERIVHEIGHSTLTMMGIPHNGKEAIYERQHQTLLVLMLYKSVLGALRDVYQIRVSNDETSKPITLQTRVACNRQVCVEVFPLLQTSKDLPPHRDCTGEFWLDPKIVKSESDVSCFNFDSMQRKGPVVVLSAGNQSVLGILDTLHCLFLQNAVVYLKLHPIRNYLEGFFCKLLKPLLDQGYVKIEAHSTLQRASALIHHPLVQGVHLTGGKATHDAIVWGTTEDHKKPSKPVLHAEMTSELGAVSPWIVVPGKYSMEELKDQACLAAFFIHLNASCNCNAPKVFVLPKDWEQGDLFVRIVERQLQKYPLPVPYYTGCQQRWNTYRQKYPQGRLLESKSGLGVEERNLSPPFYPGCSPQQDTKAALLPYQALEFHIDLSNAADQKAASQEYAFSTEPFCPVFSIVRLSKSKSSSPTAEQAEQGLKDFCRTAATFCNDYLFGSLSATITVPPSLSKGTDVQTLIASLQYGAIGVNHWGGTCIQCPEGAWGAFPGEGLRSVESGRGRIHNVLGVVGVQKFVLTSPIVSPTSHVRLAPYRRMGRILQAVNQNTIHPSVLANLRLISAVTGISVVTLFSIGGAFVAVVLGIGYATFAASSTADA